MVNKDGEPVDNEEEKVGAVSTSTESEDSENEQYDEEATAIKFKIIEIRHQEQEKDGQKGPKQQNMRGPDPNRLVKIENRKTNKPRHQFLMDFMSKKQNTMLF